MKLRHLDDWNAQRQRVAVNYIARLEHVPDITLPKVLLDAEHAWHLFVIRHPERNRLQRHLNNCGIETLIHYPVAPHLSNAYRNDVWSVGEFAITERLQDEVLSLPMGPKFDEVDRVCEAIESFR